MDQMYYRNGLNDRRFSEKQVVLPRVGIGENDVGINGKDCLTFATKTKLH